MEDFRYRCPSRLDRARTQALIDNKPFNDEEWLKQKSDQAARELVEYMKTDKYKEHVKRVRRAYDGK